MAENEARRETDELLRELEREINAEYRRAEEELRAKLRKYFADYERKDRIKREQVKRGIISEDEYVRWRMGQLAIGQRWQEQLDVITRDMRNSAQIARSITEGYMPSVYAINHNYATYEAEKGAMVDTSYTLYSRETVERIMREDPELLPAPGRRVNSLIAQGRANRWDRKVVQSSMLQGILQGESIPNIATRISRNLGETNRKAALRYARTMTTGAENAGHEDAYKRAQSKGIEMRQMWLATLDGRTRDSHRALDGETAEVGEEFSNGCRFPGDPSGPAEEIWNCRCRLIAQVKGFEIDPTDPTVRRFDKLEGMSYEEWRRGHGVSEPIEKPDEIARRMRYAYGAEYRKGMKGGNVGETGILPPSAGNSGASVGSSVPSLSSSAASAGGTDAGRLASGAAPVDNGGKSGIINNSSRKPGAVKPEEIQPDYYVGKNGRALPAIYKDWIGENQMQAYLERAESEEAKRYIKNDFRPNSFIGDGSTAAIREFEIATGLNCGRNGKGHEQKVDDLIRSINRILRNELPEQDMQILKKMRQRLKEVSGNVDI